jgi:hypothetical protein
VSIVEVSETGKLEILHRMRVRIRLSRGTKVRQKGRKNKHVALALASLLTPAAVMACVLAFWRLSADLKVTNLFPITDGLFSHWQVWVSGAAALQLFAVVLNRYGNPDSVIQNSVEDEPQRTLVNSRY